MQVFETLAEHALPDTELALLRSSAALGQVRFGCQEFRQTLCHKPKYANPKKFLIRRQQLVLCMLQIICPYLTPGLDSLQVPCEFSNKEKMFIHLCSGRRRGSELLVS